MKYSRVRLAGMGYELAPDVMTSASLEEKLAPLYERFRLQRGQLEALTGIRERRWWPAGHKNAEGALRAAEKALAAASISPAEIGTLIYGGVCRDHLEPATACAVAAALGVAPAAEVYDISNACLGVMNGIVQIANRIELGQIRAGLIVSCESAREIVENSIERMNAAMSMEVFRLSMATLTGGSGAVAFVLADAALAEGKPRLAGGIARAAPEHHAMCRWEFGNNNGCREGAQFMETDAIAVMKHGVELGSAAWDDFLAETGWRADEIGGVICHQVGAANRRAILSAIGVAEEKDFSTFAYLGNMGTVSLPLTAALAEERGFLERGSRVAFLGIGSGLNCLMLGWEW